MMMNAILLLATVAAANSGENQKGIDAVLTPVLDACVRTDLQEQSPEVGLAADGWVAGQGGYLSPGGNAKVFVSWPGDKESAASCFVFSPDFTAGDYNDWFEGQLGPATSIPWDPKTPLAGWRIEVSGHKADIYVGEGKHPETGAPSPVIHILQSERY
ncbi:MAG: hypothetical protein AAGL10_03960 [Pseudomonadota bacterium]